MTIIIRKAIAGDEKGIAELFTESIKNGFFNYTGLNISPSKERLKKMRNSYSSKEKNFCVLVAIDSEKKIIVGTASFKGKKEGRTRHCVELGCSVREEYTRKGIGTQLIKNLIAEAKKRKIRRLEANVVIKNIASVRLVQKFNFKIEGIKKDGLLLDNGRYINIYMFGKILK